MLDRLFKEYTESVKTNEGLMHEYVLELIINYIISQCIERNLDIFQYEFHKKFHDYETAVKTNDEKKALCTLSTIIEAINQILDQPLHDPFVDEEEDLASSTTIKVKKDDDISSIQDRTAKKHSESFSIYTDHYPDGAFASYASAKEYHEDLSSISSELTTPEMSFTETTIHELEDTLQLEESMTLLSRKQILKQIFCQKSEVANIIDTLIGVHDIAGARAFLNQYFLEDDQGLELAGQILEEFE